MKTFYEKPEAEVIFFRTLENLAVIEDDVKEPDGDVSSRDF